MTCLVGGVSLIDDILSLRLADLRVLWRCFDTFLLHVRRGQTLAVEEILAASEGLSLLLLAMPHVGKCIFVRDRKRWIDNRRVITL